GNVAWNRDARAGPRKAAVVAVDRGDAEAVPGQRLKIAHHVGHASIPGNVHALALRIRQLGPEGCRQAKAEGGYIAPPRETSRNLRLIDRTDLVARVPRVAGHEGIFGVEDLHQVTVHPVGVARL